MSRSDIIRRTEKPCCLSKFCNCCATLVQGCPATKGHAQLRSPTFLVFGNPDALPSRFGRCARLLCFVFQPASRMTCIAAFWKTKSLANAFASRLRRSGFYGCLAKSLLVVAWFGSLLGARTISYHLVSAAPQNARPKDTPAQIPLGFGSQLTPSSLGISRSRYSALLQRSGRPAKYCKIHGVVVALVRKSLSCLLVCFRI